MPKALITGVTGQSGSYLAELLLSKGYEVYGMKRRLSVDGLERVRHLAGLLNFVDGDLLDSGSLSRLVRDIQPDEVYNLGAQSFVRTSFDQPELTGEVTGLGATRILEACRNNAPEAKFYQASSSELFGNAKPPHNENTMFYPRSPYGVAKLYAHWMTRNYREAYGMFACSGILFNHESPRRGKEFVTQKIAQGAAAIAAGKLDKLRLGNLDARRDWGHARDYVQAMWLMLQHEEPGDYVVATGESHSVQEFVEFAFDRVGLDWREHVCIDEQHFRPAEVDHLRGDASRARRILGWSPETTFRQLVHEMVDHAVAHPEEWSKD